MVSYSIIVNFVCRQIRKIFQKNIFVSESAFCHPVGRAYIESAAVSEPAAVKYRRFVEDFERKFIRRERKARYELVGGEHFVLRDAEFAFFVFAVHKAELVVR